MNKSWSEDCQQLSYNNWLREEAQNSRDLLLKNTARLQAQLRVLDSVISQEMISSQRLTRVLVAENHLMTELHLLVISTEVNL